MPPEWLTVIAWIWLRVAFITSGLILFDIFVGGHRQQMGMMEPVYPITALYIGPLAFGLTVADRSLFRRVHRGIQSRRRARVVFQYFAIPPMRGSGSGKGSNRCERGFRLLTFVEIGLFPG